MDNLLLRILIPISDLLHFSDNRSTAPIEPSTAPLDPSIAYSYIEPYTAFLEPSPAPLKPSTAVPVEPFTALSLQLL